MLATEIRVLFNGAHNGRCVQLVDVLREEDRTRIARFVNLHVPSASQRSSCTSVNVQS